MPIRDSVFASIKWVRMWFAEFSELVEESSVSNTGDGSPCDGDPSQENRSVRRAPSIDSEDVCLLGKPGMEWSSQTLTEG